MNINKFKKILILLLLLLSFFSCVTGSRKNRGSLSSAMDKAKDSYQEDRTVPSGNDNYFDFGDYERSRRDSTPYISPSDRRSDAEDFILIFRGRTSYFEAPYFTSPGDMEVLIGSSINDFIESYFYGGVKLLTTNPNHEVSETIKNEAFMLTGGLETRYYPFNSLNIFTPYLAGRIGGFYMGWEFKNTLSDKDYDIIQSDLLGGFTLDVGLGVDIIHLDNFRLGLQVTPKGYLFGNETSEGFTNDYFTAYGDIGISLEAGYKF